MKKLNFLFLATGLLIVGCSQGSTTPAKQSYTYGEDAVATRTELQNAVVQSISEWSGVDANASLKLSLNGTQPVQENSQELTTLEGSVEGNTSIKASISKSLNVNNLLKLRAESTFTLKSKQSYQNNWEEDTNVANVSLAYSNATLKTSKEAEAKENDYLFVAATLKTTKESSSTKKEEDTTKQGILIDDVIENIISSVTPVTPTTQATDETQNPFNEIINTVITNAVGFAKKDNTYYVELDFAKIDFSSILATITTSIPTITAEGKLYGVISFDKDQKLTSIELSSEGIRLGLTQDQLKLNASLDVNAKVSNYEKEVKSITQDELDKFGYENIVYQPGTSSTN